MRQYFFKLALESRVLNCKVLRYQDCAITDHVVRHQIYSKNVYVDKPVTPFLCQVMTTKTSYMKSYD